MKAFNMQRIGQGIGQGTHNVLTWEWTKAIAFWLIISAGTMAECVFLFASLWMTINSSVHSFVLLFLSDETTKHISELATTAYVGLPELILALAIVTVITHVRMWLYSKSLGAAIWIALYGLPTLVFLVLSAITLGCSVASTTFIMPMPLVVIRALAGFMFALTALLYHYLGLPQERDRLEKKDRLLSTMAEQNTATITSLELQSADTLAALQQKMDTLVSELRNDNQVLRASLDSANREIENLKSLLADAKSMKEQLQNAMAKSDDIALQAYSEECLNWLKGAGKSVSLDEITRFTGITKRKIGVAIDRGTLQTASRNKELILTSTLVPWLRSLQKVTISPDGRTDEFPALRLVNG
jgi:hypothetical protein